MANFLNRVLSSQCFLLLLLIATALLFAGEAGCNSVAISSDANAKLAAENYRDSPVERFVAHHLGDLLPKMRDELIERKRKGEGFLKRHFKAWIKPRNWFPSFPNQGRWFIG